MPQTTTATLQPIPMVAFNGNCAEAMHFYETIFGAEITSKTLAKDTPFADQMPPEFADKVLNIQLRLPGGGLLYGGDCPPHIPYAPVKGVTLALNLDTVEEAKGLFDKLSEGGDVAMAFGPTFWAEGFGMVADKFGVSWALNGALKIMG